MMGKFLLLAAAGVTLAGVPGPGVQAAAGLWDPAVRVCDLQANGGGTLLVRGFLVVHAQGYLLTDAECPDKNLAIQDSRVVYRFMQEMDPTGERFGNPLGEGTWGEIQLRGSIAPASGRLTFSEVARYERHDVVDSRWLAGASERGPGPKERGFDAALVESPSPRRIDGLGFYLVVDGELSDAQATALLKLSALKNTESISICRLTPALTYVRVLCHWQAPGWINLGSWVYARHGKSWKLMKHMDGVAR